jgi:hypothetical protein
MTRLKLIQRQHTLVYGLKLLPDYVLPEGEHAQVTISDAGPGVTMTLHKITGSKTEIRRALMQSIEAFFEIYGENLP